MTREDVYSLIPEHHLLHDQPLREKCADVWIEVLEGSVWEKENRITGCMFSGGGNVTPDCPEDNISHTGLVARLCDTLYNGMGEYFKKTGPCNREYLIAGALIHDVGKFIEYRPEGGEIVQSKNAKMFRHPCVGAYFAKKHGMPDEVVFAVLSHSRALSPEGGNAVNTPESIILKCVDDMVFNYAKIYYGVRKQ